LFLAKGITEPMREERKRGGITLSASVYRAVLAVKDERGDALAAHAVFDP